MLRQQLSRRSSLGDESLASTSSDVTIDQSTAPGSYERRSSWSSFVKSIQQRGNNGTSNSSSVASRTMSSEGGSSVCDDDDTNSLSSSTDEAMSLDRRKNARKNLAMNIRRRIIPPRRRIILPLDTTTSSNAPSVTTALPNVPPGRSMLASELYVTCDTSAPTPSPLSTSMPGTPARACDTMAETSAEIKISEAHEVLPVGRHNAVASSTEPRTKLAVTETESKVRVESKVLSRRNLAEAFDMWMEALNELRQSPEMSSFIHSTCVVTFTVMDRVVHVVTLPVVVPYKVCESAFCLLRNGSVHVATQSSTLLTNLIVGKSSAGESTKAPSRNHPLALVVRSAVDIQSMVFWTLPVTVAGLASAITCNAISTALAVIGVRSHDCDDPEYDDLALQESGEGTDSRSTPSSLVHPSRKQPSSPSMQKGCATDSQDFLERLRLDVDIHRQPKPENQDGVEVKRCNLPVVTESDSNMKTSKHVEHGPLDVASPTSRFEPIKLQITPVVETSLHLLRVNDIELVDENHENCVVSYLDLGSDCIHQRAVLKKALDLLVVRGLSMLANHPPARLSCKTYTTTPVTEVKWNPIGPSTKNVLGRMSQMSNTLDRLHLLEKETLIWSGDYAFEKGYENYGRNFSMYLARGIVPLSPHDFMRLMWDDKRTKDYNQYSKGRSTEIPIENADSILSQGSSPDSCDDSPSKITTSATKAIRSETCVPLTKFTIETKCLMHVRALDAPDDGYVIISRSLDRGDGGMHYREGGVDKKIGRKNVDKCDNQILWGVNILKSVPNHPHLTDLISLSQVSTPNVPGFFGRRIAMMGIEDFFKNIRKVAAS